MPRRSLLYPSNMHHRERTEAAESGDGPIDVESVLIYLKGYRRVRDRKLHAFLTNPTFWSRWSRGGMEPFFEKDLAEKGWIAQILWMWTTNLPSSASSCTLSFESQKGTLRSRRVKGSLGDFVRSSSAKRKRCFRNGQS